MELLQEKNKDPNIMFSELDKGLHSMRIGEQCAAIVKYPQLFQSYPFPIMIKSSFIKLANVFRTGTNFMRLCIIQVTRQSTRHLEKLTNVDEIVRCIHSVMHSNDPVARALTLKLLAAMACVIHKDKAIQHSILCSLESRDKVELEAAMHAAAAFTSYSKSFSRDVCSKLEKMLHSLWVPLYLKLSIISLCQNMTCHMDTLTNVRELFLKVLKSYPSEKFASSVLHTLTILSCKSSASIEDQLELLCHFLTEDPRLKVKISSLRALLLLAQLQPHFFLQHHIKLLVTQFSINQIESPIKQILILQVLNKLSCSLSLLFFSPNTNYYTEIRSLISSACYNPSLLSSSSLTTLSSQPTSSSSFSSPHSFSLFPSIPLLGLELMTNYFRYKKKNYKFNSFSIIEQSSIAIYQNDKTHVGEDVGEEINDKDEEMDQYRFIVEMLMTLSYKSSNPASLIIMKKVAKTCSSLSSLFPIIVHPLTEHSFQLIAYNKNNLEKNIVLCEFISSIHHLIKKRNYFKRKIKTLLSSLLSGKRQNDGNYVTSLIRLFLQLDCIEDSCLKNDNNENEDEEEDEDKNSEDDGDDDDEFLTKVSSLLDGWNIYKVVRQAMRHNRHKLSSSLFTQLFPMAANESQYYWFEALKYISMSQVSLTKDGNYRGEEEGENINEKDLFERMKKSEEFLEKSLLSLRTAITVSNSFNFQINYITLRLKTLNLFLDILQIGFTFKTIPPPAIASSMAVTTGNESHKYHHVLSQLQKCRRKADVLLESLNQFLSSCFDADPFSLNHINQQIHILNYFLKFIDLLILVDERSEVTLKDLTPFFPDFGRTTGVDLIIQRKIKMTHQKLINQLNFFQSQSLKPTLNHKIISFMETLIKKIVTFPCFLPRFFFQRLQTTDIKLVIFPPMKSADELMLARCDIDMVLKVEGIITTSNKISNLGNKPFKIRLLVKTKNISSSNILNSQSNVELTHLCEIIKDYFSHKFLICFPNPGIYQVCIEVKIVDKSGLEWNSQVTSFFKVQAFDEAQFKQQQINQIK